MRKTSTRTEPAVKLHPPTSSLPVLGVHGAETGFTPLTELPVKGRVICRGYVLETTTVPAGELPIFVARVSERAPEPGELETPIYLTLRWLGQHSVSGVRPGICLLFEGMLAPRQGEPTIHNPRYEILPA